MTYPNRTRKIRLVSDYYNSIVLKMSPKPSPLELTILSIIDGICKGNKRKGTCRLSLQELTKLVSFRMPSHSVHPDSIKGARRKLIDRGLLIQTGTWNRRKILTSAIPRAEVEGFKGLQIPLEAATSPHLSHAAKLIFGRLHYLLTVNEEKRIYLDWTNQRLADDLNIGLGQVIQGLGQLREHNFIFIHHRDSKNRKVGLNFDWAALNKNYLPSFEKESKISKGGKSITVKHYKKGKSITVKSGKIPLEIQNKVINLASYAAEAKEVLEPNKLKDNKYYFPLENKAEQQSSAKGDSMPVYQTRAVERVLACWGSKQPPLQRSGPKVVNKAIPIIKQILAKYSEATIEKCFDLYHRSLHNPTLMCQKMNKKSPYRVSIKEFFEFSLDSKIFIQQYKIKGFDNVNSWFDLCLKGETEIENRFTLVPADKYPIVTALLKRIVSSWDGHPPIVGGTAEKQLRRSSAKLVEFHQQIKPRITDWRKVMKASTPEFLKEHLGTYILNNFNLDSFKLYWLMSDNFIYKFERYLEDMRVLSRLETPERRRDWTSDKGIPFGSGSGEADCNRDDSECKVFAEDF